MYCTRCGKQVEGGNRFCQFCGQDMSAAGTLASPAQPPLTPSAVASTSLPPAESLRPAASVLPYGGFGARLVAFLIDGIILTIPLALVFGAMFFGGAFRAMAHPPEQPQNPQEVFAVMAPMFATMGMIWLAAIVLQWLYFAGMESSARQATIGKSVMSLRVTDTDGRRLSFGHATGRFFAKIVSGLIPFAIGYLMAAFTEKKQALHDMIAGTLVLK